MNPGYPQLLWITWVLFILFEDISLASPYEDKAVCLGVITCVRIARKSWRYRSCSEVYTANLH